ncbi:MAG: hypothetical protein AAFQ83_06200 [Bacteroidota bacterium]
MAIKTNRSFEYFLTHMFQSQSTYPKTFFPLWGLLLGIAICMTSCEDTKDSDVKGDEYRIPIIRLDQQISACVHAMQGKSSEEKQEVFDQYLADDQSFLFDFLGYDYYVKLGRLTQSEADSLARIQWIGLLSDSAMVALSDSISQQYPEDFDFEGQLMPPLQRMHKVLPDVQIDTLYTHFNGYDPRSTAADIDQFAAPENKLSVGLHYFMGKSFDYYPPQIPAFVRRRYTPENMDVLMMHFIADGVVAPLPNDQSPTLLDGVMRAGIKQYFVHEMLPYEADSTLMMYTKSQMEWADFFERDIYQELIDKLFETKFAYQQTYLAEKPYTTTLVIESAPRIGVFSGWRIVKAYMDRHPEVTLAELIERTDYEAMFKEARYRP